MTDFRKYLIKLLKEEKVNSNKVYWVLINFKNYIDPDLKYLNVSSLNIKPTIEFFESKDESLVNINGLSFAWNIPVNIPEEEIFNPNNEKDWKIFEEGFELKKYYPESYNEIEDLLKNDEWNNLDIIERGLDQKIIKWLFDLENDFYKGFIDNKRLFIFKEKINHFKVIENDIDFIINYIGIIYNENINLETSQILINYIEDGNNVIAVKNKLIELLKKKLEIDKL
jgi:hypothetical protein